MKSLTGIYYSPILNKIVIVKASPMFGSLIFRIEEHTDQASSTKFELLHFLEVCAFEKIGEVRELV